VAVVAWGFAARGATLLVAALLAGGGLGWGQLPGQGVQVLGVHAGQPRVGQHP
jgi:hypothetical protein